MQIGTAKISEAETAQGYRYFVVNYRNIGSFLQCEPQGFATEQEAREFCRSRKLRILSFAPSNRE